MFNRLAKYVLRGDTRGNTIIGWISGFVSIVLIRSFFEIFSSPSSSGLIATGSQHIHYLLFFLATLLLITLTVSIFTKQRGGDVINLALLGFPIIFLVPTVDFLLSKGAGFHIDYLFDTHGQLLIDFLTFFGPLHTHGISMGIRIETALSLCAIGWYVWIKTKNKLSTFGSILFSYSFVFIMLAMPGFLFTISHAPTEGGVSSLALFTFMKAAVLNSNLPANMLHGTFSYGSETRLLTLGFSTITAQIFFVLSFIVGLMWFWYAYKNIMKSVFENARSTRVLFYMSLLTFGVTFAHIKFSYSFTWVDWIGFTTLGISWFCSWMFAVHTNDLADIEIDSISNPNRPLPKNSLSPQMMRDIGFIWLLLSLVGSYTLGYIPFFMNIIFTSVYYLYSAPPLRLKRIPILSSFLNSITCLTAILAGFFFISPDKTLLSFPTAYIVGIIIVFTLNSNIRDLKDIEGDRVGGIQTLPVMFKKYGSHVVGLLLAISFLLFPFFVSFYSLYIVSIPSAIIGYWLCVRHPYKEAYLFTLYFVFCMLSFFVYTTIV